MDRDADLDRAVQAIERESAVTVDTEFHSERRHHPELMLLQVGTMTGEVWIFDPRAIDVSPAIRALSTRKVYLHAGQADLALLKREADSYPMDVLDIQICAGMLGMRYPARLGQIAHQLLGLQLDKEATLSDWARRPLSDAQLQYAASDVATLVPLVGATLDELSKKGRSDWAQAASTAMAHQATRPSSTDHKWLDWDITHQLDPDTQAALYTIFEWRNARGKDKDQPDHFMLSDGLALDVARRKPTSLAQLQANRRVPNGLIKRYGEEIIRAVSLADPMELAAIHIPTARERQVADALQLWASIYGSTIDLAPELAMPRAVALKIAHQGSDALSGWRAQAFGDALALFLRGEARVALVDGTPTIV